MGGFLFIIIFLFVLLPITIIFLIAWATSKKAIYGKAIGFGWLSIFMLFLLLSIISVFTRQKKIWQNDIYGEYIIDRTKFAGKQANWQYNHFRFEITKNNEFLFHETDKEKIIKTNTAKVEFISGYTSSHILIKTDSLKHHIIEEKPTLYRQVWSFYYVFKSPKFRNVFFKKGHWKPIDN